MGNPDRVAEASCWHGEQDFPLDVNQQIFVDKNKSKDKLSSPVTLFKERLLVFMATFRYLIRFKDVSRKILLGEAGAPKKAETLLGSSVSIYQGSAPWDPKLHLTARTAEVKEVQQL
jgi:hypothetical protein